MTLRRLVVIVLAGAACVANADFLYTMDDSRNVLQKFDLNSLALSDVGGTGAPGDFGDLSWGGNGSMYWVAGRGNPSLYTLNTNTGAATLVGSHGVSDMFGLGYNYSNGKMYSSQFSGGTGIFEMNTANGSATQIGNSPGGIGGMTFVPGVGMVGTHDGGGELLLINPNGTTTQLSAGGGFIDDCDIAYDPVRNALWCMDWSGNVFRYDVGNNYARTTIMTGLGPHDGVEYMNAVPEPVSMIALGAGIAAMIRRRRK